MCIYDETRYTCGATTRHIIAPCSYSDQVICVEHIRWTEDRGEECDNCRNTQQEAIDPVYGIESLLTASTNSCAGSVYLWSSSLDAVSRSPSILVSEHGTESPTARQEHCEGQDQGHVSSVSTTSRSGRESDEAVTLEERSAPPAPQSEESSTEDDEVGGVKLDDEDRRVFAEIDQASGSDGSVEGNEQQAGGCEDANVGLTPWFYG